MKTDPWYVVFIDGGIYWRNRETGETKPDVCITPGLASKDLATKSP